MFASANSKTLAVLEKACNEIPLSKEELVYLIQLDENSPDADALRQAGRYVSRKKFGTNAMLLFQTGIEAFPCVADCAFCAFGKSRFSEKSCAMSDEQIQAINANISGQGVYAHFLLFMHDSEFKSIAKAVESAMKNLPEGTDLVLNCGDLDRTQLKELKAMGVRGAYHVLRLGEESDTKLLKADRIKTIESIKEEGLDWYTCCEPVGPEHTAGEIAEQIFLARRLSCFQNAVMRRICVTDIMKKRGQISLLRSAQLVAVVALAMVGNTELSSIAVHEPDLLGLYCGANCVYAEVGANPRDTELETSKNRGYSVEKCKNMLKDSGLTSLMQVGHDFVSL